MAKKGKLPPVERERSGAEDKARYWLKQIAASGAAEADWKTASSKIWKLYRNAERSKNQADSAYNILFANVEVLKGVLYQKPPVPEVRRRFRDADPVGRVAAEVLDRALTFTIDSGTFDDNLRCVVLDRLVPGRGVSYVKYVPTFAPQSPMDEGAAQQPSGRLDDDPEFEAAPEVIYEEVRTEYVEWDMFRYSSGVKRWEKVKWVAFGDVLDEADLKKRFPNVWDKVALNYAESGAQKDDDSPFDDDVGQTRTGRALVWMIWSKVDRKVYWVSPGYTEGLLGVKDDPLKLKEFFPCPRPLYGQWSTNSLVPVPDYLQYQDQAEELNSISQRIINLISTLRRHGVYDSQFPELQKVLRSQDGTFTAVENYANLMEKGGVQNTLYEMPIEGVAKVVASLYTERQQAIQAIYDITGISDILRGQSDPNETLGAQQLKSNYGNARIGPQQREIQRYARDLLRIMAEVIAEQFSQKTLEMITGIKLPTAQEKMAAQMQQQAQGPQPGQGAQQMPQGQQAPPAQQGPNPMNEPTWDDVMALLKNEKLRGTSIDVETDSTLVLDEAEDKKATSELVNGLGLAVQSLTPAVQGGALSMDAAKEILMSIVRQSGFGYRVEEAIEASQPSAPPDPAAAEQAKAQADMQGKAQLTQMQGQQTMEIEKLKLQGQLQMKQMDNEQALAIEKLRMEKEAGLEGMRHQNKTDLEFMKGGVAGMDGSRSPLADRFMEMMQALQQMSEGLQALSQQQQVEGQQVADLGQSIQTILARLTAPKRIVYGPDGQAQGVEVAGFGTQPVARDAQGRIAGTGSVQ